MSSENEETDAYQALYLPDILILRYSKDWKVSGMTSQCGHIISVSFMKEVLLAAKAHIKKYKTDEMVDFENYKLEKVWEERELEQRALSVKRKEAERANPRICETNIYLILDVNRGLYKIGQSNNVITRFGQLKTANAGIGLICSYYAASEHEFCMHNYFESRKVSGEWFDLKEDGVAKFHEYFSAINAPLTQYKDAQLCQ